MAVTDQTLQNEIQTQLLEVPNNGASYGSGLYTVAEVQARLNYNADLFNKFANVTTQVAIFAATPNSKVQDFSSVIPAMTDIIAVFYTSNNGGTWYNIPEGSSFEGDIFITDQSSVTLPSLYTLDSAAPLTLNLFPAPTATTSLIAIIYLPNIGTLPTAPNGTALAIPDDFTPYVKYGALGDLFRKAGEAYDPARADICEQLFQLGVETAKSWLSSEPPQAS